MTAALGDELDGPQVGVGYGTGLRDDGVGTYEFQVKLETMPYPKKITRSQEREGTREH